MYQFKSRVRFSEVDSNQKLTLHAILNYFQDCSIFHAEHIGAGISVLAEHGHIFYLTSWQIVVDRYPALGEEISVGTWSYGFRGFYGYRNFTIEDASGTVIAYANTIWTFMSVKDLTPVRIPVPVQKAYTFEPAYPMENAPRKIRVPEGGIQMEPVAVHKFQVDINQHMNNTQYVLIAQEYLPENTDVKQLRADYRKSAALKDTIYPLVVSEDNRTIVSLNDSNGNPYAIIEFTRR